MSSLLASITIVFVSMVFLLGSSAHAGSIDFPESEFCVFGTGADTSPHPFEVNFLTPINGTTDGCGFDVILPVSATTTQIRDTVVSAINGCGLFGKAVNGTTAVACAAPGIGFTISTLNAKSTLWIEIASTMTQVTDVTAIQFNPVISTAVPEPTSGILLMTGTLGLFVCARRRKNRLN